MVLELSKLNRAVDVAVELVAEWPRIKRLALVMILRQLADRIEAMT